MANRKKSPKKEYSVLGLEVVNYKARVDAAINYSVLDQAHYEDDAKVYEFGTHLEIQAKQTYPEEEAGDPYEFSIHGKASSDPEFQMTLDDCQKRRDDGSRVYRSVRGKQVPIYEVPKGIGILERWRGQKTWFGWFWVNEMTTAQMLTLLPIVRPLYIELHRLKFERHF